MSVVLSSYGLRVIVVSFDNRRLDAALSLDLKVSYLNIFLYQLAARSIRGGAAHGSCGYFSK